MSSGGLALLFLSSLTAFVGGNDLVVTLDEPNVCFINSLKGAQVSESAVRQSSQMSECQIGKLVQLMRKQARCRREDPTFLADWCLNRSVGRRCRSRPVCCTRVRGPEVQLEWATKAFHPYLPAEPPLDDISLSLLHTY